MDVHDGESQTQTESRLSEAPSTYRRSAQRVISSVSNHFSLTDLDAPNYNHGGGRVAYSGQQTIEPGAFKYESPCPPNGQHRYRWTARAKNKDSKTLAKAESMKKYP